MIKKLSLIVMLSATLVACSSQPKVVEVPVYSCPAPDIIPKPSLETDRITESSTVPQVLRAYGKDIPVLKSYSTALEEQLKVYRKLATGNPAETLESSTK